MNQRFDPDCARVEELAGAIALGALTADEHDAVRAHLETCERPHAEVRSASGAGVVLASALQPVEPSPALRDRLMASAASTPQEHGARTAQRAAAAEPPPRRGWLDWLSPGWARGLAAAAVVAVVALGAWNVSLQSQLTGSQRVTQALASATAVYQVTGEAGRGLLIDTPDGPRFLSTGIEPAPAGSLY
jgi:anti-sigma factor RsiW